MLHALEECLHAVGTTTATVEGPLKIVYCVEVRGKLYYSKQYQRVKKRNSFTIDSNGLNKFGLIEYFVFVCEQVIAVIKPLTPLPESAKSHFDFTNSVLDDVSYSCQSRTFWIL